MEHGCQQMMEGCHIKFKTGISRGDHTLHKISIFIVETIKAIIIIISNSSNVGTCILYTVHM